MNDYNESEDYYDNDESNQEEDDGYIDVHNFKGIYYGDETQKRYFEFGAHFSYKDICKRLNRLIQQETMKSTTANTYEFFSSSKSIEKSNKESEVSDIKPLKQIFKELNRVKDNNEVSESKVLYEKASNNMSNNHSSSRNKHNPPTEAFKTHFKYYSIDSAIKNNKYITNDNQEKSLNYTEKVLNQIRINKIELEGSSKTRNLNNNFENTLSLLSKNTLGAGFDTTMQRLRESKELKKDKETKELGRNLYRTKLVLPEKKIIALNKKSLNFKIHDQSSQSNTKKLLPNVIKHNLELIKESKRKDSISDRNHAYELENALPAFNVNLSSKHTHLPGKSSKRNNSLAVTENYAIKSNLIGQQSRLLVDQPKHNNQKTRNTNQGLKDCFSLSPKIKSNIDQDTKLSNEASNTVCLKNYNCSIIAKNPNKIKITKGSSTKKAKEYFINDNEDKKYTRNGPKNALNQNPVSFMSYFKNSFSKNKTSVNAGIHDDSY